MNHQYNKTITACFIGYIVQAIVNNFVPLLFLTFQRTYDIPLSQITLLVTFNFGVQLLVDLLSVGFVDRIGYRASMVMAHMLAAAGLILTLGKCVFGYFTDRLGSFRSSNLFGSFLIAGLALCCFAFVPSKGLFMLAMVVLGFGLPLSTVGLSVWAMDFSDMDSYPTVLKWFQLAHSIGGMAFSMVPGIIADIFGSYVPAYILFTGFAVISFLIVFVTYMKQMKKTQ